MIREENIKLIFGLKVRQLRQKRGLNFQELSKKTGISVSYLNEIEKGKKYPKADKIVALAALFEISYDSLVSLRLEAELKPIGELLHSNILQELPMDMFGLESGTILEILSKAPAKVNAFISTLIQITRNFDMNKGQLYFATLKSYQEMYDNYFPEIELYAANFREKYIENSDGSIPSAVLRGLLEDIYNYTIDEQGIVSHAALGEIRSILKRSSLKPVLLMNPKLSEPQRSFIFARELAFNYMDLSPRPDTSTWVEINSFDEVLNNFKASYFASALMIPEKAIAERCRLFFSNKKFEMRILERLLDKYGVTAEMLMQRMTNIIPKYIGINELFFLKFSKQINSNEFQLTKELHLGGQQSPHGNELQEHYCRKWMAIKSIWTSALSEQSLNITGGQISSYYESDKSYFLCSIAPSKSEVESRFNSLSIGILLDDKNRGKINFLEDPNIAKEMVGVTCENCPAQDCNVRQSEPYKYLLAKRKVDLKHALNDILGMNN